MRIKQPKGIRVWTFIVQGAIKFYVQQIQHTGKDYILLLSKDIQMLFSYTVHNSGIDNWDWSPVQTPSAFSARMSVTMHWRPEAQEPKNPYGPPQGSPSVRAQTLQQPQGSQTVPAPLGQSSSVTSSHSDGLQTQLNPQVRDTDNPHSTTTVHSMTSGLPSSPASELGAHFP